MTGSMCIATTAWVLLVLGVLLRKQRSKHVPLVLSSVVLDFVLLIYLQVTRNAVQTAVGFTLTTPQMLHIGFSLLAVVLYVPVLLLGILLFRNPANRSIRQRHRRFAISAFVCRTFGFLFMFSMVK